MSNPSKKPTHRAYAVKGDSENAIWREIGALWPHKDGKGFNIKLDVIPIDGSDIAIRVIEPRQPEPVQATQAWVGAR